MPVCALPDGAAMAYADAGAGSPVLLVHGWAAHGGFFADLSARLARTHRVLVPTLRGHPGSAHGSSPCTIETLADDIAHFAAALDLKHATALGWSMGAMALWAAAPKLGARLGRDHRRRHGAAPGQRRRLARRLGRRLRRGRRRRHARQKSTPTGRPTSRASRRACSRRRVREARPDLVAWAAGEMSKADPATMASFWRSMADQDFRAALARIAQPMLVIHGGDSQVYPDGATAFVARAAPNAQRVVIPGAGHVPHLEAPDAFFNHVEAFVRAQRRSELRGGALS